MRNAIFILITVGLALTMGEGRCQQSNAGKVSSLDANSVAAWRALKKKPPLPAEANRNRVLAENALQEKRFEDAARYYEAGLAVEPLWPDGQYNAALLQGELGRYASAAAHARAYLQLLPEAQDAQAMEEKIIVWDEKVKHPPPPPPPDPSTYAHFNVDDHVSCDPYGASRYDGWVASQTGNAVSVTYFLDGKTEPITADKCQLVAGVSSYPIFEIGDEVSCKWKGYGKYFDGKVIDKQRGLVTVQYDSDNTREQTTADMCKRD